MTGADKVLNGFAFLFVVELYWKPADEAKFGEHYDVLDARVS